MVKNPWHLSPKKSGLINSKKKGNWQVKKSIDNDSKNPSHRKYFHCYATANDSFFYFKDLRNLKRIKNLDPGVDQVFLFLAISDVRKSNPLDRLFVKMAKAMFKDHPIITLVEIFHKPNIGRDFSSYQMLLDKVRPMASANDYILFQNRSGCGPFRTEWYQKFVTQFEKPANVAICGSTINFFDHPSRSLKDDLPHIQTYSFMSTLFFMNMLGAGFPGAKETDRCEIITKGEIGLSQFFLERGYKITCIEWPDLAICNQSQSPHTIDVRKSVTANHCFYHRKYSKTKLLLRNLTS